MAALVAPPNIAFSIRGQATVVKDQLETADQFAVVEIQVTEVKSDSGSSVDIRTAITISVRQDVLEVLRKDMAEVEKV